MAVAFVKNHTVASNKTAGTTLAIPLDTDVPAGNLIVVRVVTDNGAAAFSPGVTVIIFTRAAGETNAWSSSGAGAAYPSAGTAGAFSSGAIYRILTTVLWPAGSYTMTLDTSVTQKAAFFQEFSGVLSTVRSTSGANYSTTTTAASATTTGTTPVIGDLALGFIFGSNVAANQAGSNNTTGGSWSAVAGVGSTGGNVATNNWGVGQYKILTTASHQTLNNSAAMTAGNGALVTILQQYVPPAITQASYRFYAGDGGELGQLVDSYPETNADTGYIVEQSGTSHGQSFRGAGQPLTGAGFFLYRTGSPAGTISAALYAHTGTFGTSTGVPTGSPLATSTTTTTAMTIPTTQAAAAWQEFVFDGTYTLTDTTPYFIVLTTSSANTVGNSLIIRADESAPTAAGRAAAWSGTSWSASNVSDSVFRVYAGTGALAAEDTVYAADVTAGDVNVLLRERLQLTTAIATNATDDWRLQWERTAGTATLADSYPLVNTNTGFGTTVAGNGRGQSFLGTGGLLTRIGLGLNRSGSATGTITAYLYARSGTFGSTSVGTGSPLATSTTTVDFATLPTTPTMTYFDFAGTYTLVNGTPYVIVASFSGGTGTLSFSADSSTPTHAGNESVLASGSWSNSDGAGLDLVFEVYTKTVTTGNVQFGATVAPADSANVTNAAATTNRLGAGTGSFVAGKVSETGEVTDFGWSANNYTEFLYSIFFEVHRPRQR